VNWIATAYWMSDLSPNEGSKIFYGGGINTAYFESFMRQKSNAKIPKETIHIQRNQ
jgi:hypothetical protein